MTRKLWPALLAAASLVLAGPAAAADQTPGTELAKAAIEVCSGAEPIDIPSTEARAMARGWAPFRDDQFGKGRAARKSRTSEWMVKNDRGLIDALAMLSLMSEPPIPMKKGQRALVCHVLVPAPVVGELMRHVAANYGVPNDPDAYFLKREGGKARVLGLAEMIDEVPVMVSKLQPGEQLILITSNRDPAGKLGSVFVTVFEQPATGAAP